MSISFFDVVEDKVIGSVVASGKSTYGFALDKLFPLIDRFDAQRKTQDKKFYKRLERDLIEGCVMPPLTIAFVNPELINLDKGAIERYVNENIESGYVLDGIQRLNTLYQLINNPELNKEAPIYLNIIIAPNEDKLLYRMITLNNGQKPMTPRHQIEILTHELFDFTNFDIDVQTEKERSQKIIKDSFNLGDISKAYLAFLTGEVNNENNKIIGEKMDQIIIGRIMDKKPSSGDLDFKTILKIIERHSSNTRIKKWLKVSNNLIGFCVGIKSSYNLISEIESVDFCNAIELFDLAFKGINPSKVNLGKFRRMLSKEFIENYERFSTLDEIELIEQFMEITA